MDNEKEKDINSNEQNETGKNENEKLLNQEAVNAIVSKRVGKEKAKFEKQLEEFQSNSLSARLASKYSITEDEVEKLIEGSLKKEALAEIADEAEEMGISPEVLLELRQTKAENKSLKEKDKSRKDEVARKKAKEEEFNKQVLDFEERFPDIDINKLNKNEGFNSFYEKVNESVSLADAYESYSNLVGDAKSRELASKAYKEERSTNEKDVNGSSAKDQLTQDQLNLCEENGIEPEKFLADLKKSIYAKK